MATTVNADPVHSAVAGVTVYVADCAVFVGLVNVPLMFAAALPVAPPVNPPLTLGAAQLYVVDAGTMPFVGLTGATLNAVPLHAVAVIALIAGFGLTVTATVKVDPGTVRADRCYRIGHHDRCVGRVAKRPADI